ncbi:MAG: M12 family metallo-peptidase [Dehalococcoidia bacterium]
MWLLSQKIRVKTIIDNTTVKGLVLTVLAISLLFFNCSNSLTENPRTSFNDESVESDTAEDFAKLPGDLVFYSDTSGETSVYLLADVAVDEDFVNQIGDGWETQAHRMVEEANAFLSEVDLNIRVASIQQWHSDGTQDSMAGHLSSAEEQIQRAPGHLLLAITCQDTGKTDGLAQKSMSRIIVRFYHECPKCNSVLIAHEVGHLLGAGHHENEEECTEEGCIMDHRGYAHTTWCQHHKQLIRENIAERLVAQGPQDQEAAEVK